jgi:hypothetical protein
MGISRIAPLLLVLCSILEVHDARAQSVITVCRDIIGKRLTPPAQWDEDGITGGSVTVTRHGSRYDLIIKDATGALFSALADGAKITKLDGDNDQEFTLALAYPLGQVEVYRFQLDAIGGGIMLFAMLKNGAVAASLFAARCARN